MHLILRVSSKGASADCFADFPDTGITRNQIQCQIGVEEGSRKSPHCPDTSLRYLGRTLSCDRRWSGVIVVLWMQVDVRLDALQNLGASKDEQKLTYYQQASSRAKSTTPQNTVTYILKNS
eukprot:6234991-Amphidinium_carterae.1